MSELRDYRWEITGNNIEVANELVLNNPTIRVIRVDYDVVEKLADITLNFKEQGGAFWHASTVQIPVQNTEEGLDRDAIAGAIELIYPSAVRTFPIT